MELQTHHISHPVGEYANIIAEVEYKKNPVQIFLTSNVQIVEKTFSYFLAPGMKEKNEAKLNLLYMDHYVYSKNHEYIQSHFVNLPYTSGQENCQLVQLVPAMANVPSVKITPRVYAPESGQSVPETMFYSWLRNVTREHFTFCIREVIPYGGLGFARVNWVAVASMVTDNSSMIEQYHIDIPKGDHCIKQVLHQRYLKEPVVFVSAESPNKQSAMAAPLAWVEEADDNRIEVI